MDSIINMILQNLKTINVEGPTIFAIIGFVFLAIFRKWLILFLTLITIGLGWITHDLIIFNINTDMQLISVPFLIYCIGGGAVLLLLIISFFKFSI